VGEDLLFSILRGCDPVAERVEVGLRRSHHVTVVDVLLGVAVLLRGRLIHGVDAMG
jgi:hypothetical protein